MTLLLDRFGRSFPYLRISLTELCNFRCQYCLPDGFRGEHQAQYLRLDEILRAVKAFATLGAYKIRLTGGEPTLRKDLLEIIESVRAVPGIRQVVMSTNGYRLHEWRDWQRAGLSGLNVSVDSLAAARFHQLTGHGRLPALLAAVEQILANGGPKLKLNAVWHRGINDDELESWLGYLKSRALDVRLIELMQTGENEHYFRAHHQPLSPLIALLQARAWIEHKRNDSAGPARVFGHADYAGRIGLITPYAEQFCFSCNRLRLTARGGLRLCLFGEDGIELRPLLQSDQDLSELLERIQSALRGKLASHQLALGKVGVTANLAQTGG